MKLKKGQRVTCNIDGTLIKDAKIQKENGKFYICQNEINRSISKDKLGYEYSWCIGRGTKEDLKYFKVTDLKLLPYTIENIDYPDIIENETGRMKVLARINDLVFVSYLSEFNDSFSCPFLISELKRRGFKPVWSEEDQNVKDAIELLKKKGKIKDGQILED
jgi:hypothetical protein